MLLGVHLRQGSLKLEGTNGFPTLASPYDDLDLGRRLVLEPEHVAVAILVRAATLLVEVVPTHIHRHQPLAKSLRGDEGGPDGHEPLRTKAFGAPSKAASISSRAAIGTLPVSDNTREGTA